MGEAYHKGVPLLGVSENPTDKLLEKKNSQGWSTWKRMEDFTMSNPGTFEKLHVDWQPDIQFQSMVVVFPVPWPVDGSSILGIYIYIYTCHVCI